MTSTRQLGRKVITFAEP